MRYSESLMHAHRGKDTESTQIKLRSERTTEKVEMKIDVTSKDQSGSQKVLTEEHINSWEMEVDGRNRQTNIPQQIYERNFPRSRFNLDLITITRFSWNSYPLEH